MIWVINFKDKLFLLGWEKLVKQITRGGSSIPLNRVAKEFKKEKNR